MPGSELEALSAWVWEVALSGRVVETLGIGPARLTSMKRMSGEEVVVLSQHESSGSSGNEGRGVRLFLFLIFFFLNHMDNSENEGDSVTLQWLLSKFQSDFPGKLCMSWDLHSTVAGKVEPFISFSPVSIFCH